MSAAQQLLFRAIPKVHGGKYARGRRKSARPIVTKRPMHLVMRAEAARGRWSFLRKENAQKIRTLVSAFGKRWQVRVYEAGNGGNHLHLLVRGQTRAGIRSFLRALSGAIAMAITGAKKGNPLSKRFWDKLVFTRIVEWGRAFEIAKDYVGSHAPFFPKKENQNSLTAPSAIPKEFRSAG